MTALKAGLNKNYKIAVAMEPVTSFLSPNGNVSLLHYSTVFLQGDNYINIPW